MTTKEEMTERIVSLIKAGAEAANATPTALVEIAREGQQIILPPDMEIPTAITALQNRWEHDQQEVTVIENIYAYPWDAAWALEKVIERRFGWSSPQVKMTFFGPQNPARISIEVGVDKTENVSWGEFKLPGLNGTFSTELGLPDSRHPIAYMVLRATVKRKDEMIVKQLAQEAREYLRDGGSIYQGKAFKLAFVDQNGRREAIPQPRFLSVENAVPERLIFKEDLLRQVETHLFTPVQYRDRLKMHGIPFRRGVLLAGPYGTGKTELAFTVANLATQNGITFIYASAASDLTQAILFAQQYEPAVVFIEDLDRVTSGDRDAEMDKLLNILDGIDTKGHDVMVVMTTNNVESIHQAVLRPGRLDAVVEVTAPDAAAAERLVWMYGRGLIPMGEDLYEVGNYLAGRIPAVIREVVERAKLGSIRHTEAGELSVTAQDLLTSAQTMSTQLDLLNRPPRMEPTDLQIASNLIGASLGRALSGYMLSRYDEEKDTFVHTSNDEDDAVERIRAAL